MKISVVVTLLNEEKSIGDLLGSLIYQSRRANEIVVVDGGSRDSTAAIVKNFQKKYKNIKLIVRKCSRSQGRNIGVKASRYPIIAMTDAGCVLDPKWLERITEPFKNKSVDIVAGFYKIVIENSFQKALSVFLGVSNFDENFLPSTRSIAFRKRIWRRVGGFPENLEDTAEDTIFNYKAIKKKAKIVRVKNAVVYWPIPKDMRTAMKKIYSYAKGDAKSKLFWHPTKKFQSHNIKVLLVFARYFIGLIFVFLSFNNPFLLIPIGFFVILYIFWAFYKVYRRFSDLKAGIWGVILQFLADISVMAGFVSGIIS